jgi:predicted transporter
MEYRTLIIGMLFAMGMFAVKSGVGLHYLLTQKRNLKTKMGSLFLYSLVYLCLFLVSAFILLRIDIIPYFKRVQAFMQSGMLVHIIMAVGLIIWGIMLLKGGEAHEKGSKGWLALIVPCPVCMTVIFLTAAVLISFFPDAGYAAVLWGYAGFMAIVVVTVIGMTILGIRSKSTPEFNMGAAMLFIAVYFILSVAIMPQFGDIDKIYRLALYEGEKQTVRYSALVLFYSAVAILLTLGFIGTKMRWRKRQSWR